MTGEKDVKNITDDRKKWWAKELVQEIGQNCTKIGQNYKLIPKNDVYC